MASRIFLDQPLTTGDIITLPDDAARHLVQVLRMRVDETLIVFNGTGGEYEAILSSVNKRDAQARIGKFHDVNRESPLRVTLAQCVSKGERMDYTLQKAVELGVTEIVPLLSARSVVKLDAERWDKKLEHWRGVIVSACEQSGRTSLPVLHPVQALDAWLAATPTDALKLTLAPNASHGLRDIAADNRDIILLVGPEGGLSETEIRAAQAQGFTALALGPRILRTETAGVATLAAIQTLWGDWSHSC
ncbi:MAG: 16S rRNA (uracil(1498)-N(3))-methyltransferase [Stenotrophobium sp.]